MADVVKLLEDVISECTRGLSPEEQVAVLRALQNFLAARVEGLEKIR